MSKITSVNNDNIDGNEAMLLIKTTLKLAGWTVPRSSDGLTYNSSGDQITHAGSGANGMANNYAWFDLQSPNGEHEWSFQRGTYQTRWRVKVSPYDGFTGGSPDATHVATAADQILLFGTGTDASPGINNALLPTDDLYRLHIIAEDAPVGTAVPIYPFWIFTTATGSGAFFTAIFQEAMDPDTFPELSSGTRASPVTGDPDPCIYHCKANVSNAWNVATWTSDVNGPMMYYKMNYVDEADVYCDCGRYKSTSHFGAPAVGTQVLGVNPYDGKDYGYPMLCGRSSDLSHPGLKGYTNHLRLNSVIRGYPNTINLSSNSYVYIGDCLVPWEDGTEPLM